MILLVLIQGRDLVPAPPELVLPSCCGLGSRLRMTIEDLVAEGDKVVARVTASGTPEPDAVVGGGHSKHQEGVGEARCLS